MNTKQSQNMNGGGDVITSLPPVDESQSGSGDDDLPGLIDETASDDENEDEDWLEVYDPADAPQSLVCLVDACSWSLPSSRNAATSDDSLAVREFFQHLTDQHPLWSDLFSKQSEVEALLSDQYDWIRFVNFFRSQKSANWRDLLSSHEWQAKSDDLLRPVLADDGLLNIDVETIRAVCLSCQPSLDPVSQVTERQPPPPPSMDALAHQNRLLTLQLDRCKKLLREVITENDPKTFRQNSLLNDVDQYFASYAGADIHADMIADRVRTDSYRDFMSLNSSALFRGKTVLDVGAGSCVLSLFASDAGAEHVYAVEAAGNTFANATETLHHNKLQSRITLLNSQVETVQLPVQKVDVIISEWMGYFLLFESMLDSVMLAARRFLSPETGRIYPRHYSLHLQGLHLSDRGKTVDFWLDVYGYAMPAFHRANFVEAHVLDVCSWLKTGMASLVTPQAACLRSLDLMQRLHAGDDDVQCIDKQTFELVISVSGGGVTTLDALVGYFDVRFDDDAPIKVEFSTSPTSKSTHWKQTVFYLSRPIKVCSGDTVTGWLSTRRPKDQPRALDITIHLDTPEACEQTFALHC